MSKHVSYRGVTIDMDSIRRENEHVPAIGNNRVNARGDQLSNGTIVKTADQIARENHNTQVSIVNAGLKGPVPSASGILDQAKPIAKVYPKKTVEKELPSGDIIIEKE